MNATVTREELFQQVLIEKATGEETTEELRQYCIEVGMFEFDRGLKRATEAYMDRVIRGLARQKGWVDRDGRPLRLFNVVRNDPETGKPTHVYVDLKFATFEDRRYLVNDRLSKANYFHAEAKEIYDDSVKVFGRKFQKLFQFD